MSESDPVNSVGAAAGTMVPSTNGKPEDPPLTILSASDNVQGRLSMRGDGQILGSFQGDIDCEGELMIGPQAQVIANITTVRITVAGLVRGNLVATGRLRITSSGRLEGDAKVGSLIVQEGGVHLGAIRVHPEGVPTAEEEPPVEPLPAAPAPITVPQLNLNAPVERVKKFWGEFF